MNTQPRTHANEPKNKVSDENLCLICLARPVRVLFILKREVLCIYMRSARRVRIGESERKTEGEQVNGAYSSRE